MTKELIKSYIDSVGLVEHQLASFNEFIDYRLQHILDEIGEIELEVPEIAEFKIRLGKIRIPKPSIKEADGAVRFIAPQETRIRDLTYASPMYVEMIPVINGVEQEPQEIQLGELPIMVRSKMCTLHGLNRDELIAAGEDPDDPGSYFIINGTERVIVMVEEVLSNRPIIEVKDDVITARINSEVAGFVQKHLIERKNSTVYASFANLKKLPVVVLLRALGLETDEDIINAISKKKREMEESFFNIVEFEVRTRDEAFDYIGKKIKIPQKEYRDQRVNDILDKYLLPHLGQTSQTRLEKANYLAKVMRKMVRTSIEGLPEQDIDHYAFKRIRSVGDFLEVLFRSLLLGKYGLVSRIVYSYQKLVRRGKMPAIKSIVESDYMTKRIISHMATGQWIGGRTGICQRLERTNMIRTLGHLRNLLSPLSSTQEHFKARALHPTQWGRLCCEETPEGINIGLRKYLALMGIMSETAPEKDREMIASLVSKEKPGEFAVFMDGRFLATAASPEKILQRIRDKRRAGIITPHVSIGIDTIFQEVNINTDSGRLMRPLIVVDDGQPRLNTKHIENVKRNETSWTDLINQGVIEYLDAEEENSSNVALDESKLSPSMTHLEVTQIAILGLAGCLVPFAEHNRGDRVSFGAKMSGQALGIFSKNFLARTETKSDVLLYSQRPLVETVVSRYIDITQGQNVIIAISPFHGYNMEDAIVFNKSSIERGMGRSIAFRTYTIEEKRYFGIERDEIKVPDKTITGYKTEDTYSNLSSDGIINREVFVKAGDAIVGRVSPLRFFNPTESFMVGVESRRDTSELIRYGEEGIVDNVLLTETATGDKLIKVVVRNERLPELGDKFASRHGQKGIVGVIVPEADMPFASSGIIPDVIINPHAIPSRMTIGQLLEMIGGKAGALLGKTIDATPFIRDMSEDQLRKALEKLGFRNDGKETMYDGETGKQFESEILIGPCYFQKLHHMVSNKMHARGRGPVTLLTKQPTSGRSKQGGLRLGEMEKDCLIAHGASMLLKERFGSDRANLPICVKCGLIAIDDKLKGKMWCPLCKKSAITYVEMSYAFKLMLDELKAAGIYPKILAQ